jgi:hypothetical protein
VKRKWLILPVYSCLALVVLLAWFWAEAFRQDALLDARLQDAKERGERAHDREERALDRYNRLARDGAPAEEVNQARADIVAARQEEQAARQEFQAAVTEKPPRLDRWPAAVRTAVRDEVRRRTGW